MIVKMGPSLGSHALAATAQLRNRLPTQLRRSLHLYIACVVVVLFLLNMNLFQSASQQTRSSSSASPPAAGPMKEPLQVRSDFPHKIWQTWKVTPLAFEAEALDTARTWTGKNPNYRYEVVTDHNEMTYVEYHFGPEGFNRPDIVEFYRGLKAQIVKADVLRYMVMYAEGGVYADIDVEALKPVPKFIPDRYDAKDIDMVVGIEIDEPDWKDHPILGPKSQSFCQWTFMCKPRLPVMLRLIEQIMHWLNEVARKQGVPLSKVELDFDEIISGTGPSAFTNAIIAEMNAHNPGGRPITWDDFHDLGESKIVSRVLVLTIEAFAAGQGHSNSGNHEARSALVRHFYHASNWPSKHHRYSHPLYGEVEICNWKKDCVRQWDKNVAEFNKLSKSEQKKLIAQKETEQKAREEEERKRKEKEEAAKKKKEEEEQEKRKMEEEQKKKGGEGDGEKVKASEKQEGPKS